MSLDDLPAPQLFGEDYLAAQLLEMVLRYCGMTAGELDSGGIPVHAELMALCDEGGLIEITDRTGGRIRAKLLPEGRAIIEQLRTEHERDRAAQLEHERSHPP